MSSRLTHDLAGAGVGCLAILALLFVLTPMQALLAVGATGCVAAAAAVKPCGLSPRVLPAVLLGAALAGVLALPSGWLQLHPSEYKELSQTLAVGGMRIVAERSSPLGVQWDVIGASYYPFWTRKPVTQLAGFARTVTSRYDKDLFIMEVGFNWSPTLPNGYPGRLADNGPYPATMSSPAGEQKFMDEFLSTMRHTDRVLGILYWDPIMIETQGIGWAVRDADGRPGPNVVSNTTLFDFKGRALPVLGSWRQSAWGNASSK